MAKGRKPQRPPQPHDAGTGRFVTEDYANKHPKTTVFVTPKH